MVLPPAGESISSFVPQDIAHVLRPITCKLPRVPFHRQMGPLLSSEALVAAMLFGTLMGVAF